MTIESITGRTQTTLTIKTTPKVETDSETKAPANSAAKTDSVAITAMAQGMKKAFESSSSIAFVDADRVASVKKSLADGSYQINAEKIAEKMIQYEKLMPQDNRI